MSMQATKLSRLNNRVIDVPRPYSSSEGFSALARVKGIVMSGGVVVMF